MKHLQKPINRLNKKFQKLKITGKYKSQSKSHSINAPHNTNQYLIQTYNQHLMNNTNDVESLFNEECFIQSGSMLAYIAQHNSIGMNSDSQNEINLFYVE
jgi:hypothetical protein